MVLIVSYNSSFHLKACFIAIKLSFTRKGKVFLFMENRCMCRFSTYSVHVSGTYLPYKIEKCSTNATNSKKSLNYQQGFPLAPTINEQSFLLSNACVQNPVTASHQLQTSAKVIISKMKVVTVQGATLHGSWCGINSRKHSAIQHFSFQVDPTLPNWRQVYSIHRLDWFLWHVEWYPWYCSCSFSCSG